MTQPEPQSKRVPIPKSVVEGAQDKWMPMKHTTPKGIVEYKVLVHIEAGADKPTITELKRVTDRTLNLDRQYPLPWLALVN